VNIDDYTFFNPALKSASMNHMSRAMRLFSGVKVCYRIAHQTISGNRRDVSTETNQNWGRPFMNSGCFQSRDLAVNPQDARAIASLNAEQLVGALAACCFKNDCPLKELESAVLAEAANRLQHPACGSLRR
jgi:hypothetical protein